MTYENVYVNTIEESYNCAVTMTQNVSLILARVGGGLQYLVGLCICLSVTTKLLFKLNYLKI